MKVILNPITIIKITDLVHSTVEKMTKNCGISSSPLYWVDGILFYTIEYDHKDLILESSKGTLYIDSVFYAESPFIEESKFCGFATDVIDVSGYATFEGLVKGIKEGIQWLVIYQLK